MNAQAKSSKGQSKQSKGPSVKDLAARRAEIQKQMDELRRQEAELETERRNALDKVQGNLRAAAEKAPVPESRFIVEIDENGSVTVSVHTKGRGGGRGRAPKEVPAGTYPKTYHGEKFQLVVEESGAMHVVRPDGSRMECESPTHAAKQVMGNPEASINGRKFWSVV